jgi:hypothetical protein
MTRKKENLSMDGHTEPDDATVAAEEAEATHPPGADRPGTPEEIAAADKARAADEAETRRSVAEHEKEMMEIGAEVKGEGAIE